MEDPLMGMFGNEETDNRAPVQPEEKKQMNESAGFRPETHKEEFDMGSFREENGAFSQADEGIGEEKPDENEAAAKESPMEDSAAEDTPGGGASGQEASMQKEACDTVDLSEVLEKLDALSGSISRLQSDMDSMKGKMGELQGYREAVTQLKFSLNRNQQNEERIYKELEAAKKDEHYTTIKPFLEFMVSLHIDLVNSRKQYENDKEAVIEEYGEKAYNEMIELHNFQIESIEGQLQIQGMEIREYAPDSAYVVTEQTPSKTIVEIADSDLNGKIARCETPCYLYKDKVLRKARVVLYKLTKQ